MTDFPEALADTATSLALEFGTSVERPAVLASVLERLLVWQSKIGHDFEELLRRFRERCALTGKQVRLTAADRVLTGVAEGIGDGGELLIRTPEGLRRIVQAEEVRVLGQGG